MDIVAIVKGYKQYRVVQLVPTQSHLFGMTLDANGRAGWFTYRSKAEATKAARSFAGAVFDRTVYDETPFHPMTSALKAIG